MKLNGILGKGSGKLGSSVFAISGGAQIVREHNPKVSNPNTAAQIEQRAKMKLLSQLAADLAAALFFKKKGLVSARNQFIAANMPLVEYDNEEAHVNIIKLSLSAGKTPMTAVTGTKAGNSLNIALDEPAEIPLKGVYYVGVKYVSALDDTVRVAVVGSIFTKEPQAQNTYPVTVEWPAAEIVFAVGLKDTEEAANVAYGDYDAQELNGRADLPVLTGVKDIASVYTASSGAAVEGQ